MSSFLKRLQQGPVLCDGAMGTLLYARGVFINRCYDELNVSQPELVGAIHSEYVKAGAEVLETNTFGANRYRLMRHGFEARVDEINRAGVRLARAAAAGHNVFVAGSVGPLGARIEPLGKISREEAREAFREQIEVMAAEGIDLVVLETFGSVDELHQAVLATRDAAPGLPVVAQVTIDEEGNALDGADPESFGVRLTEFGADVIGCNCSVGPAAMLDTMERLRRVTTLPLAAQPNAGMPRNVEGRNIYLCSPEYMASYARKFVAAGVSLVGGCCGTTPEHIKSMKSTLRVGEARATSFQVTLARPATEPEVKPLAQRSKLGRKIANGEFVTMVEIVPPKGTNPEKELAAAKYLRGVGIDAVNVPDSPRASARMSNQALCTLIERECNIETVMHYTCRDRNVLGIQSDLLGASALGLRNLICITGDPPKLGNYPDATAVFDVDAIGLVNIVNNLNLGVDIGANPIGSATQFVIGVGANPGISDLDQEVRRFEYKVEAGAQFAVTQPVFDLSLLERFLRRVEHCRIPVLAGIWPLTSVRNAEFMRNELRVSVPDDIIERMASASASSEQSRAEGVLIAREMLLEARAMVQGVQVSAPQGKFAAAVDVIEALGQRGESSGA
jgi:methionine synthase / methylenetetrahydrofolate reductase (NADH)